MDNQTYILAIDQGTTSSRSVIVDKSGDVIASAQEEFEQIFPKPGWVEHDANKIWNNVQSVISSSLINGNIHPSQIEAIGITNQRETTVVWDKETGLPVYNAIVWQSRQTQEIANELIEAGHTEMVREKTGLQIDAYYSATKIRWILDNIENGQERAESGELLFGTIDTWLLYKLTDGGAHKTDYSNASRTMLFNIHDLEWDQELLELLKIPEVMLPEVKSNSEVYGKTTTYHFFGETIPIAGMCGDQQGALIGQMAFEKGMVKNTYGTGSFIIMNMGEEAPVSENNLATTIGYVIDGKVNYALEGSIFVTGSAIQWLRDGLQIIEDSPETEEMAYESESDDEIYLVPAFTGLGAPHWESNARGAVYGITRGTDKNDFAKATLQSIAYLSRDVFDAMEKDTGIKIKELRVDGGASMNDYLMQFQSDITNMTVRRPKNIETTALGSAYLAGLAVGYWKDFDELKTLVGSGTTFEPNMEEAKRKELYEGWEHAVDTTIYYSRDDSSS